MPHDLLYDRKIGFGYDIRPQPYINGKWKPIIDYYVLQGDYLDAGIFDAEKVMKFVPHNFDITWKMLCFSIFFITITPIISYPR